MQSINQKDIEQLYKYIINKDVEVANQFVNNQNSKGFSNSILFEYLDEYVKTLSQEDQSKFKNGYEWFLSSSFKYFKVTMSLIKEMTETGKIKVGSETDFSYISACLEYFLKKYPQYIKEITTLKEMLIEEKNKLKTKTSGGFINAYLSSKYYFTAYEDKLYVVATSADPVTTFSTIGWSEERFNQIMDVFRNKYKDKGSLALADQFETWFHKSLKKEKPKQLTEDLENDIKLNQAKEILYELLSSGLSIYEYCHVHGKYRVLEIKNFIKTVYGTSKIGKEKTSEVISEIEAREHDNFIKELNSIVIQIENHPDFTILDYYALTKLNVDDFYDKIGPQSAIVGKFVSTNSLSKRKRFSVRMAAFSPEEELRVSRIIKGREITKEEKELIFKYLEENDIPVDQYTYKACLNKLINNDLEFNQRLKTYTKGSF